ncbi:MAG: hypothetical protein KatS3mg064_0020 [Tepidiforma sp.]|nr:MAG: hypothetical protein KatS3mg064_0020 [Tepidiforma sp.]
MYDIVPETIAAIPAATPSCPSTRFTAFVTSTIHATVTTGSSGPSATASPPGSVIRSTWNPER